MILDNLSTDIKEFLEKTSTQCFFKTANIYIEFIEKAVSQKISKQEFVDSAPAILAGLYAAGHNLESIPRKYSDKETHFDAVSDDYFDQMHNTLISIFGDQDNGAYWHLENPRTKGKTMISKCWFDESFEQIYLLLKNEIYKIEKIATDEDIEEALREIKRTFHEHWGPHCLNALNAMHYLNANEVINTFG